MGAHSLTSSRRNRQHPRSGVGPHAWREPAILRSLLAATAAAADRLARDRRNRDTPVVNTVCYDRVDRGSVRAPKPDAKGDG